MTLHSSAIQTSNPYLFRVFVWVDKSAAQSYLVDIEEARGMFPRVTNIETAVHKVARLRFSEENLQLEYED